MNHTDAPASQLVEVFDPALCCSSGVCGPSVDPVLVRVARDLAWLSRQEGIEVVRANLAQQPQAFAENAVVAEELKTGLEALPLVLVNGAVAFRGRYPEKSELCAALGLPEPAAGLGLKVVG